MENYPDTNGNGIPDAFENRRPISEILNPESAYANARIESKAFVDALDDKAYNVFSVPDHKALLLEVRAVGLSSQGACVFRSRAEVSKFIEELAYAANEAFESEN